MKRKILSILLALSLVLSCFAGSVITAYADDTCSHEWDYTILDDGSLLSVCSLCGANCSNHSWKHFSICIDDQYYGYNKCSNCCYECGEGGANGSHGVQDWELFADYWHWPTCRICGDKGDGFHTGVPDASCTCTVCGLVVHDWDSATGICNNCGTACTHSFSVSKCSICDYTCTNHNYVAKYDNASRHYFLCTICHFSKHDGNGYPIYENHVWSSTTGRCTICQGQCYHLSLTGTTCNTCGKTGCCAHNMVRNSDGSATCSKCSYHCTHQYYHGSCNYCGIDCPHNFEMYDNALDMGWGSVTCYCTLCDIQCDHEYEESSATFITVSEDDIYHVDRCLDGTYWKDKEEHTYDSSNVCTVCGHSCEHSSVSVTVSNQVYSTDGTTDYDETTTCNTCNYTATEHKTKNVGHNYSEEVVKAETLKSEATCTSAAVYYKTCSYCGLVSTSAADTFTVGEAPGHVYHEDGDETCKHQCQRCGTDGKLMIAGNAATCTTAGNNEYWTCSACGKYFADDECTEEIEKDSWIIPVDTNAHSFTYYSYNSDGTETAVCDYCGERDTRNTVITASGDAGDNAVWVLTQNNSDHDNPTYTITISGTGDMANYSSMLGQPWYEYGSEITSLIVEEGVTSVGDYAFQGCSGLTSITLPSTVTSIGTSAFDGCSALTEITIPSGVTSIGSYAFRNCSSLTEITIPAGVTGISSYVFYGCSGLTQIAIPAGVTSIGDSAFRKCSSLTDITIPTGVTSIGSYAFMDCSTLTGITLPSTVTSIGAYAFGYCSKMTNITIPSTVTSISDYMLAYCNSLTSIRIPSTVTSIGDHAFTNCKSLTSITIPSTVTSIANYAFTYCTGLTSLVFTGDAPSIVSTAFSHDTFTAYYPPGNATWTSDNMLDYGGTITWAVHEHTLTATAAKAATCTEAGSSIAYWYCTGCQKYFSDAEGTTEVQESSCVIAALGHDYVNHEAKDATCTEVGWGAYQTCTRCDYTGYVEIPATGHSLTATAAKAATCTEAGNDAYWSCSTCGKYFSDEACTDEVDENSWVIDAPGHDYIYSDNGDGTHRITCNRCTYSAQNIHAYEDNICVCGAREFTQISSASLNIEDMVSANFYFDSLPEYGIMVNDILYDASSAESTDFGYRFTVPIPAKNINDTFTIVLPDAEGLDTTFLNSYNEQVTSVSWSIEAYAEGIEEGDENLSALIATLQEYGTAAKAYFEGEELCYDGDEYSDFSDYAPTTTGTGADYYGSSLLLKENVTIRHYFTSNPGIVTVSVDDSAETLEVKQKDGLWYVDITGIAPARLDTTYTVSAGDWSLSYSVFSYFYKAMQSDNTNLQALMDYLYQYHLAAVDYFTEDEPPADWDNMDEGRDGEDEPDSNIG